MPQHRQRARPGSRPTRSDSQAVNNCLIKTKLSCAYSCAIGPDQARTNVEGTAMRRTMMTLAASAAWHARRLSGQSSRDRAPPQPRRPPSARPRAGTAAPATGFAQEILSEYDAYYLEFLRERRAVPCLQFVANAFRLTCSTCKWTEIQTPDGNCLVIVGSVSAGFQVGEAFSDDRRTVVDFPAGASAGDADGAGRPAPVLPEARCLHVEPGIQPRHMGHPGHCAELQVSQPSRQIWDFYSII